MAVFETNGASVYYECTGEGRPVLLLHGLSLDLRVMRGPFEPVFARREGWQRIYVDLPGMGRSSVGRVEASSDALLDVLLAFIDAVVPGRPLAVAGLSYGAYLAQGIAHKRPSHTLGVMLVIPVVHAEMADRILPSPVVLYRDPAAVAALSEADRQQWDMYATTQVRAVFEGAGRDMAPGWGTGDPDFATRLKSRYSFSFDVTAPEPVVQGPSLVLAGRQDAITGYVQSLRLDARYPRATLAALDGAAHMLPYERQPVFEALTLDWLDRMESFVP